MHQKASYPYGNEKGTEGTGHLLTEHNALGGNPMHAPIPKGVECSLFVVLKLERKYPMDGLCKQSPCGTWKARRWTDLSRFHGYKKQAAGKKLSCNNVEIQSYWQLSLSFLFCMQKVAVSNSCTSVEHFRNKAATSSGSRLKLVGRRNLEDWLDT